MPSHSEKTTAVQFKAFGAALLSRSASAKSFGAIYTPLADRCECDSRAPQTRLQDSNAHNTLGSLTRAVGLPIHLLQPNRCSAVIIDDLMADEGAQNILGFIVRDGTAAGGQQVSDPQATAQRLLAALEAELRRASRRAGAHSGVAIGMAPFNNLRGDTLYAASVTPRSAGKVRHSARGYWRLSVPPRLRRRGGVCLPGRSK